MRPRADEQDAIADPQEIDGLPGREAGAADHAQRAALALRQIAARGQADPAEERQGQRDPGGPEPPPPRPFGGLRAADRRLARPERAAARGIGIGRGDGRRRGHAVGPDRAGGEHRGQHPGQQGEAHAPGHETAMGRTGHPHILMLDGPAAERSPQATMSSGSSKATWPAGEPAKRLDQARWAVRTASNATGPCAVIWASSPRPRRERASPSGVGAGRPGPRPAPRVTWDAATWPKTARRSPSSRRSRSSKSTRSDKDLLLAVGVGKGQSSVVLEAAEPFGDVGLGGLGVVEPERTEALQGPAQRLGRSPATGRPAPWRSPDARRRPGPGPRSRRPRRGRPRGSRDRPS